MKKANVEYSVIHEAMEIYPCSPKAATWISKYLTANVASVIYYPQAKDGHEILALMKKDGLTVREKNPA